MKRKPKKQIPPSQRPHRIQTPEGREFQLAMARESFLEFVRDESSPCVVCGKPSAPITGTWVLSEAMARKVGVPEGRARIHYYKICPQCAAKARDGDEFTQKFVEAAVVAHHYGNGIIRFDEHEMPDVEGSIAEKEPA